MATLTVATATRAGIDMAGAACAGGGDAFANTGQEVVQFYNGSGSTITITIPTQATIDDLAVAENIVTVATLVTKVIGPFPTGIYNDANGLCQITYSGVTSLTAKVLKVPAAS